MFLCAKKNCICSIFETYAQKKLQERLPEIVFSTTDNFTSKQISKLVKKGLLRKLLPRVYTANLVESNEVIVKKNLWMFLVSEVHPFDDGNGRLARIMMNAELVHHQVSKLIIPTVYRDDYILNLKKFTNQGNPSGYVRMMNRAHAFSHWLTPSSFDELQEQLVQSNAFKESSQSVLKFVDATN